MIIGNKPHLSLLLAAAAMASEVSTKLAYTDPYRNLPDCSYTSETQSRKKVLTKKQKKARKANKFAKRNRKRNR